MQPERESCIINKSGYQKQRYQLDLNISSLFFTHHPLFDREHVLAARLLQLYESFKNRQQQNITLLLAEKVRKCFTLFNVENFKPNKGEGESICIYCICEL